MNKISKEDLRKFRIEEFKKFISSFDGIAKDRLIANYSYKMGISIRTLAEYLKLLELMKKVELRDNKYYSK